MPYPHNTFLFRPEDRFNDFRNLYNLVAHPGTPNPLSQYSSDWFQFLFAVPTFFALFGLSTNLATALATLLCFTGAFLWICRLNLGGATGVETWKNVLLCAVLSYPFLFAVDRANLEGVVFLLVFLFVRALQRERYNLAMIWLGLALAMKPFPIVLMVLLLMKKRFREVVGAGAICLTLNAIASYVQFGTFFPRHTTGLVNYQATHVYGNEGLYFGHSLWGVLKVGAFELSPHIRIPILAQIYFWFSTAVFLLMSWWMWRRKLYFWQQVALLICAMNLLPFVSADYKLLYLFLAPVPFRERTRCRAIGQDLLSALWFIADSKSLWTSGWNAGSSLWNPD